MDSGANRHAPPDPLQREAIDWLVRLTSGEATVDDGEALKAWRAKSRAHEQAFRQAALVWRRSGEAAPALAGTLSTRHASHAPTRASHALSRRALLAGAGAGAALAAGWAGVSLGVLPDFDSLTADHATRVGQQARLTLADGSSVTLDAASALDTSFTPTARSVKLVAGAALFDVAPQERPFHAIAGQGEITTRDGTFAVALGRKETLVECTRGELTIECGGRHRLTAGERMTLTAAGASAPEALDPDTAAAWSRGLLVFEDRPLSQVVDDLNRHRRGRIVLARAGLGDRRVNGVFHLDRREDIIPDLAASLKLASYALPGGIVLIR